MSLRHVYKILETLHENDDTIVYRALRNSDQAKVILKSLKPSAKNEDNMAEFLNEQSILKRIKHKNIARLIDVVSSAREYTHVFEDSEGDSLFNLLRDKKLSLSEGLYLCLELVQTIEFLHKKHIIHADINPKNIIYNPKKKSLQLIDFGYSISKEKNKLNAYLHKGTSGNLFYISPEQTGLTEFKIDYRSDFYSLGMTLYHIFLGHSPFSANDRYELVHKQIAFIPKALHLLNKDFPLVLSQIISKLIQKQPSKRYQSAQALVYDLKKCINNLHEERQITPFEIASHDFPQIRIGEVLYGRDKEVKRLKKLSKNRSKPQRVVVSGHSGIGKTRLVEEFLSYKSAPNAPIIQAKFEQINDPIPYFGFKQLMLQLVSTLNKEHLNTLLSQLSSDEIALLVFVFDELKPFFQTKKLTSIRVDQDLNLHLPLAVQSFLTLIANECTSLSIFIDDLQWADEASVKLIRESILSLDTANIHFVCSYRDDEIENNPAALRCTHEVENSKKLDFLHIALKSFSLTDLVAMLQGLFHSPKKQTEELAQTIHKKTDGNPFYFKTLIQFLLQEKEIYFSKGKWHFDTQKIQTHSASLNILSLVTAKLSTLTPMQKTCIHYLCLLGNPYDFNISTQMLQSFGYDAKLIYELEENGFIELILGQYQFVHDQLQHNIYNSIDEKEKRTLHLRIAKYMQTQMKKDENIDFVTLAFHLNHAYSPEAYPKKVFALNIQALEQMIQNNTYAQALQKVQWIQTYLFLKAKEQQSASALFHYQYLKIKVYYLNSLIDTAFDELLELIQDAQTLAQKLLCFTLLKDICVTQGTNFKQLIDFGNTLMQELGLKVPTSKKSLEASLQQLQSTISRHCLIDKPLDILKLKPMSNNKKRKIISILVDYWEAAYYQADLTRMQWSSLSIMQLSFKYGNTSESSFAYVLYGAHLVSKKAYKKASVFAHVALSLNHLFNDKKMLPKIHNFVANFINPYSKPYSSNLALYHKSLHQSRLNGDLVFGTWANYLMHFSDFLSGNSLELVHEHIQQNSSFILNSGDQKMIFIFKFLQKNIEILQDTNIDVSWEDEAEAIKLWQKENFYPALAWYAILKAQSCFLNAEFKKGLKYLDKYVHSNENEVIMFPKIRLHFIRALLMLNTSDKLNAQQEQTLEQDILEFKEYSKASPKNFKFQALLLKVESLKSQSSLWEMGKHYDLALKEARHLENSFFTTLVTLCAGRYFHALDFSDLSHHYFNEAQISLNQWGAYALAKKLKDEQAPSSILEQDLSHSSSSHINHSSKTSTQMSWQSLIKSFNAISKVKNSTELISILMNIILENASASKAAVIFKEDKGFKLKAYLDFEKQEVNTCDIDFINIDALPMTPLISAINTAKSLSLSYPKDNGAFQFDPYIQEHEPALCTIIPSIIEGSVEALLYLENSELITPFSEEQIRTLELLLTQASIVFKKTSLYESLQQNRDKLNKAQEISHVGSWQFNAQTEKIIWSEETYRIYNLEPFSIDINGEWFFSHIPEDDLEYVSQAAQKALDGERYYDVIHKIITADNKEKIVHQRAEVYLENGAQILSGTIQDITKDQESKNIILSLSQVVKQSPYTIIITNNDGKISYVNDQVFALSGYEKEELIGSGMNVFNSGKHSSEFFKELWTCIKDKKEIWRGQIINKMKDGSEADCQSTIFPILDENNEIINFVSIQEDVTQQNERDKLFLMQTRQAQMGEMISMIAHQWRQPLSIISALMNTQKVNIMLEKSSTESTLNAYDEIEDQINHLSRTISDFRDFFKPDKKASSIKNSVLISKVLSLIEHALKNDNIKVEIEVQSDPSYKTFVQEIEQVILNIFKNAQDVFLERKIEKPCIKVTCTSIKDDVLIMIEDNAKGVDKEVIDTLFLPYVSTKDQKQGTGLGLYMSKTIVEEHCKGQISVQNTQDGAKFIISLPIKGTHE